MKRNAEVVVCETCEAKIGVINEVEQKGRPGFFSNVCVPDPMPTKCPRCENSLTRAVDVPEQREQLKRTWRGLQDVNRR